MVHRIPCSMASLVLAILPALLATFAFPHQAVAQNAPRVMTQTVAKHPILDTIRLANPPALGGPQSVLSGHLPRQIAQAAHAGMADPRATIQLTVVLQPHHRAAMDILARRVNDPRDPLFGQYLTPAERIARFSPSQEELLQVAYVFQHNGLRITDVSADRMSFNVSGTTGQIARALRVEFHLYQNASGHVFYAPDRDPSLPASVAPLVLGIRGLHNASEEQSLQSVVIPHNNGNGGGTKPGLNHQMNGDFGGGNIGIYAAIGLPASEIRNVYKVGLTTTVGTNKITINGSGRTVALIERHNFDINDINYYISYNKNLATPPLALNSIPIEVHLLDGSDTTVSTETELDIEMLEAIADGLTKIVMYDENTKGVYYGLQHAVIDNTANAISISYGADESDSSSDMTWELLTEQAALQGQAIFVSSGDNGSKGPHSNSGTIVNYFCCSRWVTAVGGTDITLTADAPAQYKSETAWSKSGGGISQYLSIPDYQFNYLSLFPGSLASPASAAKRNIPDVALNSNPYTGYYTHVNGLDTETGGTSAAAPLWAGFHAQLNQYRLLNNYPTIGFLNYALYQIAEGANYNSDFHDISDGSSNGAYKTVTGYDCVTGLGTFVGVNLLGDLAVPFTGSPIQSLTGTQTLVRGTSGAFTVTLNQPVPASPAGGYANITLYRVGSSSAVNTVTIGAGQSSGVIPFTAPLETVDTYEFYYATYQYSDGTTAGTGPAIGPSAQRPVLVFAHNGLAAVTPDFSAMGLNQTINCTVSLSGPATKDELIYVDAEQPAWLSVPRSVTIKSGTSSASFQITSLAPANLLATAKFPYPIHVWAHAPTGSDLGSNIAYTIITLQKNPLGGISPAASYVAGSSGGSALMVQLTSVYVAPTGGMKILLSSSNPSAIQVPASVTIPAGKNYVNFNATVYPATSATPVTLTATYVDPTKVMANSSVSATVTVEPPATLVSMTFPSNYFISGNYLQGTLKLSSPATQPISVSVSAKPKYSQSSSANVTFQTGQSQTTFLLGDATFFTPDPIVVTASLGSVSLTTTVYAVSAVSVSSVTIQPTTVAAGGQATGTVSLYAPANAGSGGYDVFLSADKAGVVIPTSVHINVGQQSTTFPITAKTNIAQPTTINISAATDGNPVSAPITVTPPALTGLSLSSSSVAGGSTVTGTITLGAKVGINTPVALSSGDPSATVPATVTVPSGASSVNFTIKTTNVATTTSATITASLAGNSLSQTLQVQPPLLGTFTLSANSVKGGNSLTGTVTLSSPAPTGGYKISLSSGDASVIVNATATIPAGAKTVGFPIKTVKVTSQKVVTLTATGLNNQVTTQLTVTP